MRTLSTRFEMSDVGLKKHCLKMEVPVPERGYWAKCQAGKVVLRTKLSPRGPGMPDRVTIGTDPQHRWPYDPAAILAEPEPFEPTFAEPIEALRDRMARRVGRVRRERDLASPHPAIRKLLEVDDKRRAQQHQSPVLLQYYAPYFDSPFEQRRLKLLNSLFIALSKWGAKPSLRGDQARELSVGVGSQWVRFRLDHPAAEPNRHGEWSTRPGKVDKLQLALVNQSGEKHGRGWTESEGQSLEQQLSEIVVGLIVQAEIQYREGAHRQYEWQLERRAQAETELWNRKVEAEKQAREKRLREEQEARRALLDQAAALRDAREIRDLVAAVRAEADALGDAVAVERWTSWASGVADRIDPLRNLVIDENDRLMFRTAEDRAFQEN